MATQPAAGTLYKTNLRSKLLTKICNLLPAILRKYLIFNAQLSKLALATTSVGELTNDKQIGISVQIVVGEPTAIVGSI